MNKPVGFTGTRKGMSAFQKIQFTSVINWLQPGTFHHGGAEGADIEAEWLVGCAPLDCLVVLHAIDRRGPLARNRDIVTACEILIAAPDGDEEYLRSGTWATVRYARQAHKSVIMLSR